MKIAVLDDYQGVARDYANWSEIERTCEVTVFNRHLDPEEAAAALQPFEVICHMRERMPFPADLINALPNLKLVVVTGPQHRTLDVAAASAKGVLVCYTDPRPDLLQPAPELAWGLLLSVARHIPAEATAMSAGGWQTTVGETLYGKTLGVVGLGRSGRFVAGYAKAFGMRVIAWSQNLTPEAAAEGGAEYVTKEDLFQQADYVSVHLVLSERTRGIVGAKEMAAMKPGAILINTSRGPVVDEAALLDALDEGRIRAGLDVYDQEPLPSDHPLRRAPGAVLTPHIGYVTAEAYRAFYEDTVEDVEAWLAGSPVRMLNPEVLT